VAPACLPELDALRARRPEGLAGPGGEPVAQTTALIHFAVIDQH
jgi:hypothetical protein